MVENREDYLFATFVALLACVVFVAMLGFYITSSFAKKMSSTQTQTTMSLDIIIVDEIKDAKKKKVQVQKLAQSTMQNPFSTKTLSKRPKTTSTIDDLFANLDKKYDNIIEKTASNTQQSQVVSRKKTILNEQARHKSEDISKLLDEIDDKIESSNSVLENDNKPTDIYYAKIRQIISSRWLPLSSEDSVYAKVIIKIDFDGTFSYSFLSYSEDGVFNENVIAFLQSQTTKIYPIYKKNKPISIEIKFGIKGVEL
jgi:hypothetical protein